MIVLIWMEMVVQTRSPIGIVMTDKVDCLVDRNSCRTGGRFANGQKTLSSLSDT
jgi:hypothetical protein